MTVPCCALLNNLVAEAVKISGIDVLLRIFVVGIDGTLASDESFDIRLNL
jgi:hypothetical protein